MDLVGAEMVNIIRPAACRLDPGRHDSAVSPNIVRSSRAANEAKDEHRKYSKSDDHFRVLREVSWGGTCLFDESSGVRIVFVAAHRVALVADEKFFGSEAIPDGSVTRTGQGSEAGAVALAATQGPG